jgi:autotransporter-associated beta strand protein
MTASSRYFARLSPAALQPRHSITDTPPDLAFFAGPMELRPLAASPIDTAQPFYRQSGVGTTVLPDFQGGTLRINQASATDNNNYTVENFATNKIDAFGHSIIFTGTFSGAGPLEIADSAGGGSIIVTGDSILDGTLTIDKGASLQWGNGGDAYLLGGGLRTVDNGALVLNFGGGGGIIAAIPISGSGKLTLQAGSLTDSAVSTYTGSTTIDSGAFLLVSGGGSITTSSLVADNGTFDISGTTAGASIVKLTGSGAVSLGGQALTIANASGSFSGVLTDGGAFGGTGGSLTIAAGKQTLGGTNTFTGATTIDMGATLQLGAGGTTGTVAGSIVDNGLVRFDYASPVTVGSGFSGTGGVEVAAGTVIETSVSVVGTVTIEAVQSFNGATAALRFLSAAAITWLIMARWS